MEEEEKGTGNLSRRTFFKWVSAGIGSFLAALIGYPLITYLVSNSKSIIKSTFINIGSLGSIPNSFNPDQQPTKLSFTKTDQDAFVSLTKPEQVWVVKKSTKDIKVFSSICPHLGCRYNWDDGKKLFVCPCHNSIYTIDGTVVSGPAPRGLDELPIEIKDQNLYIQYEKFEIGIPEKVIIS